MTDRMKVVDAGEARRARAEAASQDDYKALGIAEAQLHEFEEKLKATETQKAKATEGVERAYGPNADSRKRIKKHLSEADRDLQRLKGELGMRGPKRRYVPMIVYALAAFFLALFEAPVNKFIFDVALRSVEIVHWIVAFCLGLMLFAFAHFNGIALRQVWSERRRQINWKNLFLVIFWTALLAFIVLGLAVARWRFSLTGGTGGLADIVTGAGQELQTVGVWELLTTALSDPAAQTLTVVNVSGVILAMFLAFMTHDPDEDYDHAIREQDRLEAQLMGLDKTRERKTAKIERRFEGKIEQLTNQVATARAHVRELQKGAINEA